MATPSLRAVTHRLTTTPVKDLPQIASFLATSLSDCGELLSAPQNQKSTKGDSDNATQIHKLKTRLASLLQDRTVEGRWTAVILVKATVEAGQWEILRGCEPLVRNLIGILGKPDPVSTKKMCIITLTRIFHLTYQYPTLVREITTPSLPAFVTAALNLISVKPSSEPSRKLKPNTPFLEVVFHALIELIGRHLTIFRPFSTQIHSVVVAVIGSSPATFPESVVDLAEQLFISLHNCAPKNTSADEWKNAIKMTLASIHRTSDFVFRAVVEQWESVDAALRQSAIPQNYGQEVGDDGPDSLGLSGWRGLHSGAERLIVLLRLLSGFLSTPTASTVAIPLGHILDLTSRLTSVTVPPEGADAAGIQLNLQIGREERDALWSELPRVHTACINLFMTIIARLQTGITPVAQTILEQMLWVFRAEKFSTEVRTSSYQLVRALLPLLGPSMTKQTVSSLTNTLRTCCHDIFPPVGDASSSPADASSDSKGKSKTNQATANADSFLQNPGLKKDDSQARASSSAFPELQRAASQLLPAVLSFVPTEYLAPSLRAEIDRTVILAVDKDAMLASVLNPVPVIKGRGVGPSIIPFLARSYACDMEVEALIRPRMPVLMNAPDLSGQVTLDEEDDDEDDEEMPESTYHTTSDFLKTPLPTVSSPTEASRGETYPEQTGPVASKRSLPEESNTLAFIAPPPVQSKEEIQTKKARFDPDNAAAPSGQLLGEKKSSAFTSVTTVPADRHTTSTVNAQPSMTTNVPMTSSAAAEDDSDDELPTLNLESDTDDDEDEEDVTMEG